jgi:phosphatidylglycerol:prolipoprotein diacylglycerol transferase
MFTSPGDIAIDLGNMKIYWYGICMAFAILLGLFTSVKIAKRYYPKVNIELFYDLMFYILIGGILGARLYYSIFNWGYFSHHLADIPKLWTGGLSIHGAIIGGFITGFYYVKSKKLNLWMYADVTTFGLIVGQIFGRLGNFFNSEAFGAPTNLPWKLFIPLINRPDGYEQFEYFHPTFLYEMIANSFILMFLLTLLKNKDPKSHGIIFFAYLVFYSIARILIEKIRIDSVYNFCGYPIAMWTSALFIIIGFAGIFLISNKKKGA